MSSMSHYHTPANGGVGEYVEGSGTINPAALDAPAVLPPTSSGLTEPSPRGVKRGRSEDVHEVYGGEDADDSKPRKRGRPPKSKIIDHPINTSHPTSTPTSQPVQNPRSASQGLTKASPSQASPVRVTGKAPVLKALPTVRDHTTDQLNPEGDEYIPREVDEAGEKKVTANGALLGEREYKCRTFWVPNRGDKLFMLATECARVLGYRDSYLLFNKNRSLHKIIANQIEKDHLIQLDILPYSYRSRQIAIVTARSMFRQFGSRVVNNGRRVRDDYWEAKALKQGFTEEDPAGEKRPGGARQRAALEAANAEAAPVPQHQIYYETKGNVSDVVYMNDPNNNPMRIMAANYQFAGVQEPRQAYAGSTFQDNRVSNTSNLETHSQAASASEFNKSITQQRLGRTKYLNDVWSRPHNPAEVPSEDTATGPNGSTQATHSPHVATAPAAQQAPRSLPQQQPNAMMAHAYNQQPGANSMPIQSPVRAMQPPLGGVPQRTPSVSGTPHQQNFGYQQPGIWHPGQPPPTPMGPQHAAMGYGQHMSQSPVQQPGHSPMHAPPQLQHQTSGGQMHGLGMGYTGMQNQAAYGNMQQRQMYQPNPGQHQFMQPGQQPPVWPPQQGQGQGQQGWQY